MEGTVKWFNNLKGYGFVTDGIEDYFVHYSAIVGKTKFKTLAENEKVTFDVEEKEHNKKQAINVKKIIHNNII